MSPWLIYAGLTTAILLGTILGLALTAIGAQSEERRRPGYITDSAHPMARSGAAARARAQSPAPPSRSEVLKAIDRAPIRLPWNMKGRFDGPMITVSGEWGTVTAPANAMHWDRFFEVPGQWSRLPGLGASVKAIADGVTPAMHDDQGLHLEAFPPQQGQDVGSEVELARRRAQQQPTEQHDLSCWPYRAEAKAAGCTCRWAGITSIIEFDVACPILNQHRDVQLLGGDAA